MSVSLMLRCLNRAKTRAFYTAVLGFDAVDSAEASLTVRKEGGSLMFTEADLWQAAPTCTGTIYFSVADVDAYYLSVKDRAPLAWPLQDMDYGTREFAVTDCNGYLIAFQQAD